MRLLLGIMFAAGSLTLAIAAYAQSDAPAPAVPTNNAAAEPVPSSKRFACKSASQGARGQQDQRDQMQLCMAQGRLDCLKQAIDKKIIGPQRREFIKSCAEE